MRLRRDDPAHFVPPRPDLGPEPWPPASPWRPWWLVVPAALLVALAIGLRRRRARLPPPMPGWSIWVAAVRDALGPAYSGLTTDELADSPTLRAALGPELAGRLVDYLRTADRARFSVEPVAADGALESAALAAAIASRIAAG